MTSITGYELLKRFHVPAALAQEHVIGVLEAFRPLEFEDLLCVRQFRPQLVDGIGAHRVVVTGQIDGLSVHQSVLHVEGDAADVFPLRVVTSRQADSRVSGLLNHGGVKLALSHVQVVEAINRRKVEECGLQVLLAPKILLCHRPVLEQDNLVPVDVGKRDSALVVKRSGRGHQCPVRTPG